MKFIDYEPRFASRIRILMVAPLMVVSPSSTKPILVLNFYFGLTGSAPSLVEIRESTVFPHTLLEVCPTHKTR